MTSEQTCPLCGEKTKKGIRNTISCSNSKCCLFVAIIDDIYWQIEDWNYQISQISRIKQQAKQEVLEEMRKFSKGLNCDETCKNNPKSCELEQRMIRAFQIIEQEIKRKSGVE